MKANYYCVAVAYYSTKRDDEGGREVDLCVKAFDRDEAREIAVRHELKGHRGRKLAYTVVDNASAGDIRNCINP